MPNLPDKTKCCGCAACVDTCKHDALSLVEDCNGFYNIKIDTSKCVDCKLCEKRCHVLRQDKVKRHNPKNAATFAGWSTDEKLIRKSATGAIFAQVACCMLSGGNTTIYGAALMDDSSVKHIGITSIDDLYKLQNSKYQQSYTVGVYRNVLHDLKNGRRVLFSGVPCQIAALYAFLNYKEELLQNLFTIEVLCHGVPTNVLHRLAIHKNHALGIKAYRNKEEGKGWLYGKNNRLSYEMSDGKIKMMQNRREDFLFRSYLTFSFTRLSCYQCLYSDIRRVSDMTIGDFWHFQDSPNKGKYENLMGSSIIIANSEKGKNMVAACQNLNIVPVEWKEFLPYNQNLFMPTNKYLFKGAAYVHLIRKIPVSLQTVIYQNGFTNAFLDRLFQKFIRKILKKRFIGKENELKKMIDKTLKYLEL